MATRKSVVPQRAPREIRSIEQLSEETISDIESAVPEDWVDDEQGQAFPPYWQPGVGKYFRGIPLYRDERDEGFHRWHVEATQPIEVCRGDKDAREIITLNKGDIFTVSGCKGLLLERYVGFEIFALVTEVSTLEPNEESEGLPRDFYRFRVRTSPAVNKQLKEVRTVVRSQMIEMAKKKALDNMLRIAAGAMNPPARPAAVAAAK